MRALAVILGVLVSVVSMAQVARPVQFREELFDFGNIVEKDGPVTHVFEFTNTSTNRPVKIITVKPSCGCTTPDWSKDVIAPGQTGFIQAKFDPKGRPGFFAKTLTVTTDGDATPVVLQIKGTVVSDAKKIASEFEAQKGNWKLKSGSFNLGKIYNKDEYVVREFSFSNGGSQAIRYSGKYDGPAYIRVHVEPATLQPGETGIVRIGYNGKQRNAYGFQSDNIVLHTNDETQPDKSFTVFATLEDYFPELTPAEARKAPRLLLSHTTLDFGRVKQDQPITREVTITNSGQSVLALHSVQGNCTCITTFAEKTSIKSGQSTTLRITFEPQERKGTQQKSVVIYSNDPKEPVQRITFTAYAD